MARWRLTQKHYLNVPGTEFEHKETTHYGKQVKKSFPVPLYLDPDDPGDCNYNFGGEPRAMSNIKDPGEIIVAWANGNQKGRDIIFVGDPTLDMEPLDEEAAAISEGMAARWGRSFVGSDDDEGGYSNRLLLELTETLNSFNATARPSSPAAPDVLADLQDKFNKMFEMNMALIGKVEPTARRV